MAEHKLRLGVFGGNIHGGLGSTLAPERFQLSWDNSVAVAKIADDAGFDVQVPIARWRAMTRNSDYNGINFETQTWAAGISAATRNSHIFSTLHVPLVHPITAAKQLATIDHISGGRVGLNVVCGWFDREFMMFGRELMRGEDAYAYAGEWTEIVRKCWTEQEFDFNGRFFQIKGGWQMPKPLQFPLPPIMNAGHSAIGSRYAAQYADLAFRTIKRNDLELTRQDAAAMKRLAREEFGRSLEVWLMGFVLCRPTQAEAERDFAYFFEQHADPEMIGHVPPEALPDEGAVSPEEMVRLKRNLLVGFLARPLVGTPDRIVDQMRELSDLGIDGIALFGVNNLTELPIFVRDVLPRLEQAGLRVPSRQAQAVAMPA